MLITDANILKRQAEQMLCTDFPSLTHSILQMGQYDDNFVQEGETVVFQTDPAFDGAQKRRLINRRDAAKAAVDALLNSDLLGKTVQVYTAVR